MAQLRNRGSNVWQIGIFLGKDDNGKKITHYETFYGTKPQARDYANKLEVQFKEKKNVPKSHNMNINDLFDRFIEAKQNNVELSTLEQYKKHIKRLRDIVGDIPLYEIDTLQIEDALNEWDASGLSPRTIKNHYTTLKTVMIWGAVKKYVPKNLMLGIQPPMVGHIVRDVLKEDEVNIFIETAKNYKHYLPLRILALTGMRIGELMGLKWKNVSLEDGKIKIVQAVNSRLRYLKNTKTENSKRELTLDEESIMELKKLKEATDGKDDDYVFQSEDHQSIRHQAIFKTKKRVLKKAGLHSVRLHDLRHGVGSILLDNGYSITDVAEQLGQVPGTTAGNYCHALRHGKSIAGIIVK